MVFIRINCFYVLEGVEKARIDFELGAVQERFAAVVWDHEPIGSGELAKICEKELNWKRPTTYTVLRKLCEKGLLENRNGTVVSLVSREDYFAGKSKQIVADSFRGSLPAFIAAFFSGKTVTEKEADEIREMIDAFQKGGRK